MAGVGKSTNTKSCNKFVYMELIFKNNQQCRPIFDSYNVHLLYLHVQAHAHVVCSNVHRWGNSDGSAATLENLSCAAGRSWNMLFP
jgi:hypothetical protein